MDHKPRKRFGQNFLQNQSVIQQIINLIHPSCSDVIIEIGPGLGALTQFLLPHCQQLHAVEIDRDLIAQLQQKFSAANFHLHQADALQFDFSTIASKQPNQKIRVVGNLPYNISTPILFHLLDFRNQIADMHFMLQKEVVDRIAAQPGSKNYGRLSVMTQYFCDTENLLHVDPSAFYPAPKVDSAIVRLSPRPFGVKLQNITSLQLVVTRSFTQRRKTLRNNLKGLIDEAALQQLNIAPSLRAETLSINQFIAMANWVDDHADGKQ